MNRTIMDEVAYLFVEQYENIRGLYSENYNKDEVALIRRTADKDKRTLYTVVSTIFGESLDEVMAGAANGAMDYIAYVDETWVPKDEEDKARTLEMQKVHLDSLEIHMAQMNERGVVWEIKDILREARRRYQRLAEED